MNAEKPHFFKFEAGKTYNFRLIGVHRPMPKHRVSSADITPWAPWPPKCQTCVKTEQEKS